MPDLDQLLDHLERVTRLSRAEAEHVLEEVLAFLEESLEEFVARRHRELRTERCNNPEIYAHIAQELSKRRFRAPELSERQIRRLIYG